MEVNVNIWWLIGGGMYALVTTILVLVAAVGKAEEYYSNTMLMESLKVELELWKDNYRKLNSDNEAIVQKIDKYLAESNQLEWYKTMVQRKFPEVAASIHHEIEVQKRAGGSDDTAV